jgi:hypothetical protein
MELVPSFLLCGGGADGSGPRADKWAYRIAGLIPSIRLKDWRAQTTGPWLRSPFINGILNLMFRAMMSQTQRNEPLWNA